MYSGQAVKHLLREYVHLRARLSARAQQSPEVITDFSSTPIPTFLKTNNLRPTQVDMSYRTRARASPVRDGKTKQREFDEVWISLLDLEAGLRRLSDEEISLVYRYYMFETCTLEELATQIGTTLQGAEFACQRAVSSLTRFMNEGDGQKEE